MANFLSGGQLGICHVTRWYVASADIAMWSSPHPNPTAATTAAASVVSSPPVPGPTWRGRQATLPQPEVRPP